MTNLSNTEEVTRTGVEESIAGGRGRSQDDSIDDVRKSRDTGVLDGNDPGGGLSTLGIGVGELGVAGADADTDDKGTENVEEQDTPEDTANGLGDVLAWVGSLSGSNGDHLNTTVRESGVDEGRPETSEATGGTSTDVLLHSTLLPVSETATIVVGSATKHDDKTSDEQSEDGDDLNRGEDEFSFSVNGDSEDVQADDDDDDEGDPNGRRVFAFSIPKLDKQGCSRDFSTECDGTLIPVVPTDSKSKSRVGVAGAVLGNSWE